MAESLVLQPDGSWQYPSTVAKLQTDLGTSATSSTAANTTATTATTPSTAGLADYTANATTNYGVDQASVFSLGSGGTYYDVKNNRWMDKNLIMDDSIIPASEYTFDQARAVDPNMTQEQYNATRKLDIGGESASKAFGNYAQGGAALGQLGLGIMSYFENKKTADAQRKALKQQYDNNAEIIKNSAADRTAAMKAFGVS